MTEQPSSTNPNETPGRQRPRATWRIVRAFVTRALIQIAIGYVHDLL